jgi:hypothetical protein
MLNLATTMPIIHDYWFSFILYEFCRTNSLGRILSLFFFFDMCVGVMDDYE